jgi:hypothetical protein
MGLVTRLRPLAPPLASQREHATRPSGSGRSTEMPLLFGIPLSVTRHFITLNGPYNVSGPDNVAVGANALFDNTVGNCNIAIGSYALFVSSVSRDNALL